MTASRGVPHRLLILALVAGLAAGVARGQAPPAGDAEAQARRWYANGVRNLDEGRTAERLKDLRTIVETYPSSTMADDALLAIATYQLEQLGDVSAAQQTITSLMGAP